MRTFLAYDLVILGMDQLPISFTLSHFSVWRLSITSLVNEIRCVALSYSYAYQVILYDVIFRNFNGDQYFALVAMTHSDVYDFQSFGLGPSYFYEDLVGGL